jgi:hypothetical protein
LQGRAQAEKVGNFDSLLVKPGRSIERNFPFTGTLSGKFTVKSKGLILQSTGSRDIYGLTSGELGFDSRLGKAIFLFYIRSRPAVGSTQTPIQWYRGAFPASELLGGAGDHSPTSSAELMNAWIYISTPPYVFMAGCLIKHRENVTILFLAASQSLETTV